MELFSLVIIKHFAIENFYTVDFNASKIEKQVYIKK